MLRNTVFRLLRAIQLLIGYAAMFYLVWQFSHGRHLGDTGIGFLLVVLSVNFAVQAVQPRKVG